MTVVEPTDVDRGQKWLDAEEIDMSPREHTSWVAAHEPDVDLKDATQEELRRVREAEANLKETLGKLGQTTKPKK